MARVNTTLILFLGLCTDAHFLFMQPSDTSALHLGRGQVPPPPPPVSMPDNTAMDVSSTDASRMSSTVSQQSSNDAKSDPLRSRHQNFKDGAKAFEDQERKKLEGTK